MIPKFVEVRIPLTIIMKGQLPPGSKILSSSGNTVQWYVKQGDTILVSSVEKSRIETLLGVQEISLSKKKLQKLLSTFNS